MRWPDIEKLGVSYLADVIGRRVATEIPSQNLAGELPMIRVARGPGSDDGITDAPLLDVESLAGSRQEAWALAEDSRQAMHALTGTSVGGALVDSVETATGPTFVAYSPTVARFVASYRLNLRQQ